MGSQRRLAESLTGNYAITEDEAWTLVHLVEAVQIGDDLSDAVYLVECGKPDEGLTELRRLRDGLMYAIAALESRMAGVKRKKTT